MRQSFTAPLPLGLAPAIEWEDRAIAVLREVYTLEDDLALARRQAKGDDLDIEPRVTAFLRNDEDDADVLWHLEHDGQTDQQAEMVRIVSKQLRPDQFTYATIHRVHRAARGVSCETSEEQEWHDGFVAMLEEKLNGQEERLELTDTEQIAIRRELPIQRARGEVKRLEAIHEAVMPVLDLMERKFPASYMLLWLQYIEQLPTGEMRTVDDVCWEMGMRMFSGATLTKRQHEDMRNRAMREFCTRCYKLPELVVRTSPKKRGPRKTG